MVCSSASSDDNLRSALDVDSDEVVVVWVSDAGDLSLAQSGEGDFCLDSVQGALDQVVDGDLCVLEELYEADFCAVADCFVESLVVHFNSGVIVVKNRFLNQVNNVIE